MKIVINTCYGGFGLSPRATELYLNKIGKECFFYKQTKFKHKDGVNEYTKISLEEAKRFSFYSTCTKDLGETCNKINNDSYWYYSFYEDRSNKELIETIEELGESESSGQHASLEIVEIPDGIEWDIDEYDGVESIHEIHRSWR